MIKQKQVLGSTNLVFPIFPCLTVKIGHSRPENQIPGAKLCILAAGMVQSREIWPKHEEKWFVLHFVKDKHILNKHLVVLTQNH